MKIACALYVHYLEVPGKVLTLLLFPLHVENISNTTVCLLCPLSNKPLGHSGYPNGIASSCVCAKPISLFLDSNCDLSN